MTDAGTAARKARRTLSADQESRKPDWLSALGPGLVTGASDDDPSGIATYSQAGAQFGFTISWTMLLSYPLMAAIQEISARIGRTTGRGIAGNIRAHAPAWLLYGIVGLLFAANTINIGADLGAMGDAVGLLTGGPPLPYIVLFGILCAALQIFMRYVQYVSILKWLALALFAYFAAVAAVHVPWAEAAHGLIVPTFSSDAAFWTTVVAVLGTTISPYLFFWQASQEAEDIRAIKAREPLVNQPRQGTRATQRIRIDTYVGMAFSNLVALAIIITTAATLHTRGGHGHRDFRTGRPRAAPDRRTLRLHRLHAWNRRHRPSGRAGSRRLGCLCGRRGARLADRSHRKPDAGEGVLRDARGGDPLGITINFSPIDPDQSLFWTRVINGVVAVPVMVIVMLHRRQIAKSWARFTIARGPLKLIGWPATLVMAAAAA